MSASDQHKEMPGWDNLDSIEISARRVIVSDLELAHSIFQNLYEAAVSTPTFGSGASKGKGIDLAALFLKRAITDWRSLWILLSVGYSSQAGALGASLWENAMASLASICDPITGLKYLQSDDGKLPWTAKRLAEIAAKNEQKLALKQGREYKNRDYQLAWRELYGMYGWLCSLKHPNARVAFHESASTKTSDSTFVLMTMPDVRPEDLRTKCSIIGLSTLPLTYAVYCYGENRFPDENEESYIKFHKRLDEVDKNVRQLVDSMPALPVVVDNRNSRTAKEWRNLKGKK